MENLVIMLEISESLEYGKVVKELSKYRYYDEEKFEETGYDIVLVEPDENHGIVVKMSNGLYMPSVVEPGKEDSHVSQWERYVEDRVGIWIVDENEYKYINREKDLVKDLVAIEISKEDSPCIRPHVVEEFKKVVKKYLIVNEEYYLRAIRNSSVRGLSDESERVEAAEGFAKGMIVWERMSMVTAVIDHMIFDMGGQV